MPSRKSNVSTVSTAADETSMVTENGSDGKMGGGESQGKSAERKKKDSTAATATGTSGEQTQLGIDDFMMPRMMTVRLAKGVLPPQTLIHRDAATALQYAASVFLNHVAAAANEHTLSSQRKNISPHDMLLGLKDTEWSSLVPQLEEELSVYVRQINDKRNEYRRKLKERGSIGTAGGLEGADLGGPGADGAADDDGGEDDAADITATSSPAMSRGDGAPRAKKARLSEGVKQDEDMDEDLPEDEEEEEEEEDEIDEDEEEEVEGVEEEEGEEEEDEDEVADDRTSEREEGDEEEDEEEGDEDSD